MWCGHGIKQRVYWFAFSRSSPRGNRQGDGTHNMEGQRIRAGGGGGERPRGVPGERPAQSLNLAVEKNILYEYKKTTQGETKFN